MRVNASRLPPGWTLVLEDGRRTTARTLEQADARVRTFLDEQEPGTDHKALPIEIVPALGDSLARARQAQDAVMAAQADTVAAARMMRAAVRDLRKQGLSVTDVAFLLGVSRGRVSQIGERDRLAEAARRRLSTPGTSGGDAN